jgi:hypothetical protein
MTAGLLLCLALSGCAGVVLAPPPVETKVQPIIPAEPALPVFSDEFNRTCPVDDLERLGNYAEEFHGVYRIMRGQLEGR